MRKIIADIGYRIYSWADGIAHRVNNKNLYLCCILISTFLTAGIFYVLITNGKTAESSLGDWFVIIFCAIIITLVLGWFLMPAFLFFVACIEMFGFLLWQPRESAENLVKVIFHGVEIMLFGALVLFPMFVLMKSCDGDKVANTEKAKNELEEVKNDIIELRKELSEHNGDIMRQGEEIRDAAYDIEAVELRDYISERAANIAWEAEESCGYEGRLEDIQEQIETAIESIEYIE